MFERFETENDISWEFVKRLCVPLWFTDQTAIRTLCDKIAMAEYRRAGDEFGKESKAEKTALWYIALGKKSILATLYKKEPAQAKVV